VAAEHGVVVVQGDVRAVPVRNGAAQVVCAGEILEHVADTDAVVAEACRILAPGGTLVIDTIASTRLARLLAVEIAERVPGAAPPGIHDPSLFVDRQSLMRAGAAGGVNLKLRGLRPSVTALVGWKTGHGSSIRMVPTGLTSVLFQAWGVKRP
jgi:2-polyprenyl-6-hydroxyphenyl methylase/3-demethylubiquinone-9 3-methyltransferase